MHLLDAHAHEIIWDSQGEFHILNEKLHDLYLKNYEIHNDLYNEAVERVFRGNLCYDDIIQKDLIPESCESYLQGTPRYVKFIF